MLNRPRPTQGCRVNRRRRRRRTFSKIVPFVRQCRKMWWSQKLCKLQYGGALHAGLVRQYTRKHTPAPVHPHTYTQACIRTHTRAHIHTQKYVTLVVFFFHDDDCFVNAPQCYVIRTLPVLLMLSSIYDMTVILSHSLSE